MIPLGELIRDSREREEFLESYHSNYGEAGWDPETFLEDHMSNLGDLVANGSKNPLTGPYKNTRMNRAAINFISSELVERYMGLKSGMELELDPNVPGGINRTVRLEREVDLLKHLAEYYVFENPALVSQRHGHREIVGELFDILFDASSEDSEYTEMIPNPFLQDVESILAQDLEVKKEKQRRARVIADIISSLTENQTLNLYGRVTGRSPGSIRDQIIG